jgi:predicted P-loop ATPase
VFAGSVNPETYLRDETGNRRFWPVRCGSIDLDALARDRDQLWAEAVTRYREGAIWWLDEPELIASAKAEQDQRYQTDAWDARIDRWLCYERRRVNHGYGSFDDWRDEEVERSQPLTDVSVGEILEGALNIEAARWTKADQMRVGAYLKTRGWERYQARKGELREWRYRKV